MKQDKIIEELHNFREEYARQFGFDTRAICKDIQEKQASSGREIVTFPPRKPRQEGTGQSSVQQFLLDSLEMTEQEFLAIEEKRRQL